MNEKCGDLEGIQTEATTFLREIFTRTQDITDMLEVNRDQLDRTFRPHYKGTQRRTPTSRTVGG